MRLKRLLLLLSLLVLWLSPLALAEPSMPDLTQYVTDQLTRWQDAVDTHINNNVCQEISSDWFLTQLYLYLDPHIAFTSGVIQAQISAQFDLVWVKDFPPGWVPYAPSPSSR